MDGRGTSHSQSHPRAQSTSSYHPPPGLLRGSQKKFLRAHYPLPPQHPALASANDFVLSASEYSLVSASVLGTMRMASWFTIEHTLR